VERRQAKVAAAGSLWSGTAVITIAMAMRPALPDTSPWFVLWLAIGVMILTFLANCRLLIDEPNRQSAPESP
jgi:hypothetical protein